MGSGTKKNNQEKEMFEAFEQQSKQILALPERFIKPENSLKIGFESETTIIKQGLKSEQTQKIRDSIIQKHPDICGDELGATQIEIRTPPIDILSKGFDAMVKSYSKTYRAIKRAAHKKEVYILRIGANPFLPVCNPPRSYHERYYKVPDFHKKHQRNDISMFIGKRRKKINVSDPSIVSLFQSFQINLEAQSLKDAIDKMNRSLMIGPFILALSGNARYLELQDTYMQDVRMLAWELSHDTRTPEELNKGKKTRIGLPEKYFLNMEDYFNRIKTFPFILYNPETALQIGVGLNWLDTRIKFIKDSAVVEFRLISTQPTIEEELGITLFFLGRLLNSQMKKEPLLPMHLVEINRKQAMIKGLHAKLWFFSDTGKIIKRSAKKILMTELEKARQGLYYIGIEESLYLDLITKRLQAGSPSDKLGILLRKQKSYQDFLEALKATSMLV